MTSNLFKLNYKDVLGAVVSAVLVAVLGYVASVTDIHALSAHQILNISVLTGAASLLKSLTTDSSGNFAGAVPVK